MKTIGMIGGMSWESTVTYYRIVNEVVKAQLGGLHSAKVLLYSVDFDEVEAQQARGAWAESADMLSGIAQNLERAGADFIVICTNTMHKVADEVAARISVPILHIAEATADALTPKGIKTVALLGTKYTMTQDFYRRKLTERGIDVLIPGAEDVEAVNDIIYGELCRGVVSAASKATYLRVMGDLAARGAEGVVLGCTEIGLLISQADTALPVFDTAHIHATAAAMRALT